MTTMLERAARAMVLAEQDQWDLPAEEWDRETLEAHGLINLVRSVLMAVREPDDSVRRSLAGGDYTTSQRDRDDSYEYVSEKNVADFCRDMIDAILNEDSAK